MKWILASFFAGWAVCAGDPAHAEGPPDEVTVHAVTVDGKNVPAIQNHSLNLGPLPSEVVFHIGSLENSRLPDLRIRYKLDGYDTNWHDGRCEMFLAVRFFNETGDQVGEKDFKVTDDSAGWNGSLINSRSTHRRETITAPPRAARLVVIISSGGPPATIGLYAVANLSVQKIRSNATPVKLMEFPPDLGLKEGTNPAVTDWVRDGNVPSMAKIVSVGRPPSQKALAILDNDPVSHAEWHNVQTTAPAVAPGDQISLEWDEMFSMGVADLHTATYQKLPEGHFIFRVAEFDLFGKPTETEYSLPVVIPPPLWRQPWFLPLCAAFVAALVLGNWRYLAWRKVRNEMLRLKSQQALEKERLRIAQDIHDDLGARITEISLASALAKKNAALPEAANEDFDRISDMSRDLVSALYETVWAVNPENDNLDSLGTYLCQITNNLCKQTQVRCRLELDDLPHNVPVSSQARHNIAMVVKEATHNAVKHAQASEITLGMTFQKPRLTICVKDNGIGFKAGECEPARGHGLKNIKRRMEKIGGTCQIEGHPGRGTEVQIQINL